MATLSKRKSIISQLGVEITPQVPKHRSIAEKEYIITLSRDLVDQVLDEFQNITAKRLLKQLNQNQ